MLNSFCDWHRTFSIPGRLAATHLYPKHLSLLFFFSSSSSTKPVVHWIRLCVLYCTMYIYLSDWFSGENCCWNGFDIFHTIKRFTFIVYCQYWEGLEKSLVGLTTRNAKSTTINSSHILLYLNEFKRIFLPYLCSLGWIALRTRFRFLQIVILYIWNRCYKGSTPYYIYIVLLQRYVLSEVCIQHEGRIFR